MNACVSPGALPFGSNLSPGRHTSLIRAGRRARLADRMDLQPALIAPEQHAAAAKLLADAFFDDPGFVYCFPDERSRHAHLTWLYTRLLRVNERLGHTYTATRDDADGALAWLSSWHPPGDEVGAVAMIRGGMLGVPLRMGALAMKRLVESAAVMTLARRDVIGRRPYWYLDLFAVAPEMQGKGIGRRLLARQIQDLAQIAPRPYMLFTSKESNVAFYRGNGFREARVDTIGGSGGYRLWSMVRDAVEIDGGRT